MDCMKKEQTGNAGAFLRLIQIWLAAVMLGACVAPPAATPPATTAADLASPVAAEASNPETSAPQPTPVGALPELPPVFTTPFLNPLDTPHGYIHDTCRYLRVKWDPSNAEPGTLVMIIMFNGVYKGTVDIFDGVEFSELRRIMKQLKAQGFEAITTEEFLAFMERNIKIPPRSVLIVRDGNHSRADYEGNFGYYWNEWSWSLVNGWTSWKDTPERLIEENALMEYEGFVDHQARGVQPTAYLTDDSSKVVIARELQGSLDAFGGDFGKNPIAIVWPNGGFGQRPVEIARQLNYQLGFTLNSRGPVMYNWVPLADQVDKKRPSYIPEGAIKDPLMTLPRYWPYQVLSSIDNVRIIGNNAREYALANKDAEFAYYKYACEAKYGPIPLTPK